MDITFPGGMKVEAHYKGHTILTDQPEADGGEGATPSPFDLFVASIGNCAGFFVLSFCQKRGIPTENISLQLQLERAPESKMIGRISISISLPADFPEKYRNAVVKAAESCSVKKHLASPPAIEITTRTAA